MLARIVLAAVALGPLLPAADDAWRFIDPGSRMIMGIEWQRIRNSPTGMRLRRELSESLPVPSLPALKFARRIDSILMASPGLVAGHENEQPPMMVAVSGSFDLAQLRASVKKKSRRAVVQNIEIYESPDKDGAKLGVALVSEELVLFGDVPTLVLAVGSAATPDAGLISRARELDETNEFWMVSSISPAELTAANLPLSLPIPLESLRSLEMGVSVRDGLSLELSVETATPEDAAELKDQLFKLVKLASKEKARADFAGIEKHLKLSVEGEFLKVSMKLDAADLDKRLRAFDARRKTILSAAPQVAAEAPPPTRAQPVNSKPVIWNLDPQND